MKMLRSLEPWLKNPRPLSLVSIGMLSLLGWWALWLMRTPESGSLAGDLLRALCVSSETPWQIADMGRAILMWLIMSIAMMLPTAAPAIITYGSLAEKDVGSNSALHRIVIFCLGYLLIWGAFGVVAAGIQWALVSFRLLTPHMEATDSFLSGGLLLFAGAYQFTPLKARCLAMCRNPFAFFFAQWREGAYGTLKMGIRHGLICVGCCWALMSLMLVMGALNLLWMALLGIAMLLEKIIPASVFAGRLAGFLLILWGLAIIFTSNIFLGVT